MKFLLIFSTLFSFAFANYNYTDENSGKIDMHGGKKSNLITEQNSLKTKDINKIGILKPTLPKSPQNLIKDEKDSNEGGKK